MVLFFLAFLRRSLPNVENAASEVYLLSLVDISLSDMLLSQETFAASNTKICSVFYHFGSGILVMKLYTPSNVLYN